MPPKAFSPSVIAKKLRDLFQYSSFFDHFISCVCVAPGAALDQFSALANIIRHATGDNVRQSVDPLRREVVARMTQCSSTATATMLLEDCILNLSSALGVVTPQGSKGFAYWTSDHLLNVSPPDAPAHDSFIEVSVLSQKRRSPDTSSSSSKRAAVDDSLLHSPESVDYSTAAAPIEIIGSPVPCDPANVVDILSSTQDLMTQQFTKMLSVARAMCDSSQIRLHQQQNEILRLKEEVSALRDKTSSVADTEKALQASAETIRVQELRIATLEEEARTSATASRAV